MHNKHVRFIICQPANVIQTKFSIICTTETYCTSYRHDKRQTSRWCKCSLLCWWFAAVCICQATAHWWCVRTTAALYGGHWSVDGVKSPETESSKDRSVVVRDSPASASTQQKLADGSVVPQFSLHQQCVTSASSLTVKCRSVRTSISSSVGVFTSSDASRAASRLSQ